MVGRRSYILLLYGRIFDLHRNGIIHARLNCWRANIIIMII